MQRFQCDEHTLIVVRHVNYNFISMDLSRIENGCVEVISTETELRLAT